MESMKRFKISQKKPRDSKWKENGISSYALCYDPRVGKPVEFIVEKSGKISQAKGNKPNTNKLKPSKPPCKPENGKIPIGSRVIQRAGIGLPRGKEEPIFRPVYNPRVLELFVKAPQNNLLFVKNRMLFEPKNIVTQCINGGDLSRGIQDELNSEALLPLIIKRAPIKTASGKGRCKRRSITVEDPDLMRLPRTGLLLPMQRTPPVFLPAPPELREPITNSVSNNDILILQQFYAEENTYKIYKKDNRLVFDIFQPPLHSKCNEDYAEYFCYNGERCNMEATNDPTSLSLLCSGKGGPTRYFSHKAKYVSMLQPFYQQVTDMDPTLIFESRFESANLRRAIQIGEFEYDLILKMDFSKLNGLAQWFFFNIRNTRRNCTYHFNIINMTKPDSLYNLGMRILTYSELSAQHGHPGWRRDGYDIAYYRNAIPRRGGGFFYTLTFSITPQYYNDSIYIASDFPYTYSDLKKLISSLCIPRFHDRIREEILCKTPAGNDMPLLVITNFSSCKEELDVRPAIVLTARVHPGESNGSHVIEGVIRYLVGSSKEAIKLRNCFIFRIVPMLNIDGKNNKKK